VSSFFSYILSFAWAGLGASELGSARPDVVVSSDNFLFVCLKQYRKVVGNRQMCSWRLLPRERLWKKVLPFVPLFISSPPDSRLLLSSFPIPAPFHLDPTAGVRGTITRYVTTIPTPSTTYHFYELDVTTLDQDWLERHERRREWVDYAEAVRRLEWKAELAQGLRSSSLGPRK